MSTDPRPMMTPDEMADLLFHPARWETTDRNKLALLLTMSLAPPSHREMPDVIASSVRNLYEFSVKRFDTQERLRLLGLMGENLDSNPFAAQSWLMVAMLDPDPEIISTAVLNLAVSIEPAEDDPLSVVRDLRTHAETRIESQVRKAGFLSGLLLLGDQRTVPILDGCWRALDIDGKQQLAKARSGFAYASVIDFYLAWLDDCIATGDDASFGSVAAALTNMTMYADRVVDVERKFPVWADDNLPPVRVLGEWSIQEYGQVIAPRLLDLSAREREAKVLNRAFPHWGIDRQPPPRTGTPPANGEARSGRSLGSRRTLDQLIELMASELSESINSEACSQCGSSLEPGFGALCASCHDRSLVDIARSTGVREIASEEWDDDYPAAGHPIWTVLQRSLDRKSPGDSVDDVYPILDELDLFETLKVGTSDSGQWAIGRIDLPYAAKNRTWVIRWNEEADSALLGACSGPDRNHRVDELVGGSTTLEVETSEHSPHTEGRPNTFVPPQAKVTLATTSAPVSATTPPPVQPSPTKIGLSADSATEVELLCSRCGTRFWSAIPRCPTCVQRLHAAVVEMHGVELDDLGLTDGDLLEPEEAMPDAFPVKPILAGAVVSFIVAFITFYIHWESGTYLILLFPAAIGVSGGFVAAVFALRQNLLFRPYYLLIPVAIGLIAYGATFWFEYEFYVDLLEDAGYENVREQFTFGEFLTFKAELPTTIGRVGRDSSEQTSDPGTSHLLWIAEAVIAGGSGYWGWRRGVRYIYSLANT